MTEGTEEGEKVKKPRATRKLELTPEMFEEAGRCALTWRHMSGMFGCNMNVIADRMRDPEFKEAFQRGKLHSQNEVIQFLFSRMRNGSEKAGIFLAQAWCHLSTKHEVTYDAEITQRFVVEVPPDQPSLDEWSKTHVPTIDHRPN